MSNPSNLPPPDVQAAAKIVDSYLRANGGTGVSLVAQPSRPLSPAEKLDHCRQFDQSKMPDWKDPRS
jgi:hypothetical protein